MTKKKTAAKKTAAKKTASNGPHLVRKAEMARNLDPNRVKEHGTVPPHPED